MNKKGVSLDKELLANLLIWVVILIILIGIIVYINRDKIINILEDIFSYRGP